jgi:hypothetical protein
MTTTRGMAATNGSGRVFWREPLPMSGALDYQTAQMRILLPSAVLLWVNVTACSTSSSEDSYVNPTFLQIAPSEFPTPPDCDPEGGGAAGTYGSYIATLVDVTESDGGMPYKAKGRFVSPPVSCRSGVRFSDSQAKTDHLYMAWIEAYASPANLLVQDGDTVKVEGQRVTPLYRFACGGRGVPEVEAALQPAGAIPQPEAGDTNDAGPADASPDAGPSDAAPSPPDPSSAVPALVNSVDLSPPVELFTGRTTPIRGCVLTQLPSAADAE